MPEAPRSCITPIGNGTPQAMPDRNPDLKLERNWTVWFPDHAPSRA